MADEEKEEGTAATEEKSGGGIGGIVAIAGVLLVAAIAGLSVYLFVLAPRLNSGDDVAGEDKERVYIPSDPVPFEFPTTFVNVLREGEMPSSTLMFGVTLECENQETYALVEKHHARFVDTISKRHDSRTRSELDDVLLIKESIQRQLHQELNAILQRVLEKPDDSIEITAVFHHTFAVQDQG